MKKQAACMVLAAVFAVQSMSSVSMAASTPENGQEAVCQAQEQLQEDPGVVQDADSGSAVVTQGKCGASAEYVLYENGVLKISGNGKVDDCLPEPNSDNYVKPWGKSYEEQYNGMIKEVRIDDGITEIGDAVFAQCSNLEFVSMCDSVTKIGKCAYADCARLWTVELSDGITSIGKYAFSGCEELSSIGVFSENLTDIGEGILAGCDQAVATVTVGSAAEEYCKKNSISYSYIDNGNAPMIVASGTCANGITWTLNAEGELHFSGDGELQGVESLEAESPSWWTYTYMTNSVVIDRGINAIGSNAFYGFLNMQKLYLGKGVNKIGDHAFQGCTSLKTLEIPDNVASIGKMAFAGCSSLQTIIFDGMAVQVEEYQETEKPFYGVNADVDCKIPGLWTESTREALGGNLNWKKRGLVIEDGLPHVYDENGTLIRNATPVIDGKKYYVDGDGVAQAGWLRLADWQMYFYPGSYAAATGITHIDGKAYLFDENGVEILRSRTEVINGRKYWFQPDGSLMSGWCNLGSWTMYYDPNTYAGARGICEIEGIRYVFDENGVLVKGGTPLIDGKKYYADANGVARSGWLRLADWQMYFDPETYSAAVGITHVDGKAYLFDENGVEILKSRTKVINGKKYWFQPDGSLMSGWCDLGSWRMYFDPITYEAAVGVRKIDGVRYEFDENGVLKS